MLNAKNQKGLAAQAMHELGNLHYHAGNIRYDYRHELGNLHYHAGNIRYDYRHELGNLHYHDGNIRYDCRNYVIYLSILFLTIYLEFINFLHDTEL